MEEKLSAKRKSPRKKGLELKQGEIQGGGREKQALGG